MLDCEMLDEEHPKPEDRPTYHENTIKELQARIDKLELKNREYLGMFCGAQVEEGSEMPNIMDMMKDDGMLSEEAMALLEESLNDLSVKN